MKRLCFCDAITIIFILRSFGYCELNAFDLSAAKSYISEIMPSIKKNLDWAAELSLKDRTKISYVDELGLEYELDEIIDFLRNITEKLKTYPYNSFTDGNLKRQIELLIIRDHKILPDKERNEIEELIKESSTIETSVKFCSYGNPDECNLRFYNIYLEMILSKEKQLKWYWLEWRNKAGKMRRPKFDRYVELYRKASELNGFRKPTEMMLNQYEDTNIVEKLSSAIEELRPLYQQLHAFLRHKLSEEYDNDTISQSQPIPIHLMDKFNKDLLLQFLDESYYPFPNERVIDANYQIDIKNVTAIKMLKESDEFFTSLGMETILKEEWEKLVQIVPKGENSCGTKSTGIFKGNSFYFVICDDHTLHNFLNIHGETLNIQRHLHTSDLPLPFRSDHTIAFAQALREGIKLTVTGRLSNQFSHEIWINHLFYMALVNLIPLFDSLVESTYLADILDGKLNSTDSNCVYWTLQEEYLGVRPPVERSNFDFDVIAAKLEGYEEDDFEDIFSTLFAYKIYEGLCKSTNKFNEHSSDLSKCDISGSEDAGNALKAMLSKGSRKRWQDLLKYLTDDTNLSGSSFLKYFKTLQNWLEEYNRKHDVHIGWEKANLCK